MVMAALGTISTSPSELTSQLRSNQASRARWASSMLHAVQFVALRPTYSCPSVQGSPQGP